MTQAELLGNVLTYDQMTYLERWFPLKILREVRVHEHQRWLDLFLPLGGGLGLTLGHHIFCRGVVSLSLLAHELVHVRQQTEFGLLRFLWLYLREWLKLRGRPISEHPLEEPAYRLQYEVQSKIAGHAISDNAVN